MVKNRGVHNQVCQASECDPCNVLFIYFFFFYLIRSFQVCFITIKRFFQFFNPTIQNVKNVTFFLLSNVLHKETLF